MGLSATILSSFIDFIFLGNNPNYLFARLISYLALIIVIPLIFYGYTIITKKSILFIDILSFYISIIISILAFYKILNIRELNFIFIYIGYVGQVIFLCLFMTLTLMPIKNFLFKDPITKKYGIN